MDLPTLKSEIEKELLGNIVPFWLEKSLDNENGGFVGRITGAGDYDWDSIKSITLNTRILWAFSALYNKYSDVQYYQMAQRAYNYIRAHFWDNEFGGVYWSVDKYGRPHESKKQIYAQAFLLNALAEFYKCEKDREVLSDAIEIFNLIEAQSFDWNKRAYMEAFTREWEPLHDVRLGPRDINSNITANTHLHLLEAYTRLFGAWKSEKLEHQLYFLIELFFRKIIDRETGVSSLYFDDSWKPMSQRISFGANIESSWLLHRALEILDESVPMDLLKVIIEMAEAVHENGLNCKRGLLYEKCSDRIDNDAHWWTQAEGMVGYLNTYILTKDPRYLENVYSIWNFIKAHMIDPELGEWHFRVTQNGLVVNSEDKIGPWKGPYHNVRSCIETIRQVDILLGT